MRNNRRADRVAEAIREEVATFLTESAKDPRIVGFVTVTAVEVSPDLRHARIFVSVLGSDDEKRQTYEGLESVTPHLRHRVARSIRLRVAPDLVFKVDETVQRAARIESLLAEIHAEKPRADDADEETE